MTTEDNNKQTLTDRQTDRQTDRGNERPRGFKRLLKNTFAHAFSDFTGMECPLWIWP